MTGLVKSRSLQPLDSSRMEVPNPRPLNSMNGPTGGVMQGNQYYGSTRGIVTYRPYREAWRDHQPLIRDMETRSRRSIKDRF